MKLDQTRARLAAEAGVSDLASILRSQPVRVTDTIPVLNGRPFKNRPDSYSVRIFPAAGYVGFHATGFSGKSRFTGSGRFGMLLPESLRVNLRLGAVSPLVLKSGSRLKGVLMVKADPIFAGGILDGEIVKRKKTLPALDLAILNGEMREIDRILSNPAELDTEYLGTICLEEGGTIRKNAYVTGSVIIEDWEGTGILIAASGRVYIQGRSRLTRCRIISSAPITISDQARLIDCRISSPEIAVGGEIFFSGTIITETLTMVGGKMDRTAIFVRGEDVNVRLNSGEITGCLVISGQGLVTVEPGLLFYGLIHSLVPISLTGTVEGYLFASELYGDPIPDYPDIRNVLEGKVLPPSRDVIIPFIYPKTGTPVLLSPPQGYSGTG